MIRKALLLVSMLVGLSSFSHAVTHLLNYQGRLTDSGGDPLTGNYSIQFSIYNVSSGGSELWTETQAVSASDGLFNALLGSVTTLDLPFDSDYWLGIKVGSDSEMTPRQRIAVAGYSIRAGTAAFATNADRLDGKHASDFAPAGGGGGDGHSLDAADGSPTDVVFVNNLGAVGIGTTAPSRPVQITYAG